MNIRHLCLRALPLIALAACKPQATPTNEAAAANTAAAAAAEAQPDPRLAGTDATAVVDNAPAQADFDAKAFSGTYAGTSPCADCPGIDVKITFNADGSYQRSDSYQGKDVALNGDGTWSVKDGNRLLLDPNGKQESDRWLLIVSRDELRTLDAEGRPLHNPMEISLKRTR